MFNYGEQSLQQIYGKEICDENILNESEAKIYFFFYVYIRNLYKKLMSLKQFTECFCF